MNFQWYPGHMTKAKRQMMEDIKLIDLVIELLDARVPLSSRNPDIDEIAGSKARLILLNKTDLADKKETEQWFRYFEDKGLNVCMINSKNFGDMKQINAIVQKACAAKIERDRKRGIKNRPVRAMVVGIPNVGKSTFINTYAKKAVAKTGNKPGVTTGKQWIRLSSTLELLDTPGILWPKFEDQSVGLKLALIGSIKDEIMNIEELAMELIKVLEKRYPGLISSFYGLENIDYDKYPVKPEAAVLEAIGTVRGCVAKGGEIDFLKAANLLLENFRNGKLGQLSLESPEEYE
ncbi:MAG: ribosome biogenesis GTPase YlqF [Lachnospiraceae bacterium]|nr:ribosome biogenesis GTPase YlqF [Lachnospiraceae bacterium]